MGNGNCNRLKEYWKEEKGEIEKIRERSKGKEEIENMREGQGRKYTPLRPAVLANLRLLRAQALFEVCC